MMLVYMTGSNFNDFIVEVANSSDSWSFVDFLFNDWSTTLIVPKIEPSMKELDKSKIDVTIACRAVAGTISAPAIIDTECHIEKQ
jgi:hypothetical protein